METYDTTVKVAYETDDEYRTCLLAAFRLQEYTGDLVKRIDTLRKTTHHPILLETAARIGTGFDEDLRYLMLFSYDEFPRTHAVLRGEVETNQGRDHGGGIVEAQDAVPAFTGGSDRAGAD